MRQLSDHRVVAIGECMVELRDTGAGTAQETLALAYGGDTLNTAVYLARLNPGSEVAVDYMTALGDDPYSEAMMAFWQGERLGTETVARLPGRLPGLYMIRTDAAGERRFFYWRSAAAARSLFDALLTLDLLDMLKGYQTIFLSAITLSILTEAARDRLVAALTAARTAGSRVVFDGNYRPAGWPDPATARAVIGRFLGLVDLALPSIDDERLLWGDVDAAAVADRMQKAGVAEVIVKQGPEGALVALAGNRQHVAVPDVVAPIDTTGAGDSFNAGYLTARLRGADPASAASAGHRVAAAVIQHRGAIIPATALPRLSF
ncbi:MAG TPA: sugar kinase [Stellaceae bacterium]|nr:sugar kinase [Stellaceae bacterium]